MTSLIDNVRERKTGQMFHDGKVKSFTVHEPNHASDYEFEVEMDGQHFIVSDSDERFGYIYRAPDSGYELTNIMVPLEDGENAPSGIPDAKTIQAKAFAALQPVFESVTQGNTDPTDLDFCRQLFNSQEAMLRTIQKEGTLNNAHKAILRDVFYIT